MDQYFDSDHPFGGTVYAFLLDPNHLLPAPGGKLLSLSFEADAGVTGSTLLVTVAVLVQSQSPANCDELDIEDLV